MRELGDLIAGLEVVMLRAPLEPEEITEAREIVGRLDAHRGFPGDAFVLALAGGTGSGKSSLLNALAGREVASVSPIRPHTDAPLVWMPPDAPADLIDLLDDLAITQRVEGDSFPGVAIVDLPDQDSIVLSHRHTVAEVLPRVDAVAWVSDPDKYHDRALHDDYIAAMRDHQGQLFFVLNKADLVDERRRSDLELDFMVQLQRDGIASPRVFVTSAAPTIGEPIGVDAVAKHIRDRLGAKRVLTGKILSDVRHALRLVAQRARVDRGTDLDFDARWEEARRVTVAALTDRPDEAVVYDTLCRLEDFVAMMSVESGGTFGRRVVDAFPPARLERELNGALAATADALGASAQKKRRARKKAGDGAAAVTLAAEIEARLGRPLRDMFWEWARFGATVASVSVDTAQAQAKLRR